MTVDAQILSALRRAGDGCVSGAELSQQLKISRAAVWARIEELRSLGYEIEASPHQGYRLISVPDVLHADDLLSLTKANQVIGRDIRVFRQTSSTNDVVEKLARDGVNEGSGRGCALTHSGARCTLDFVRGSMPKAAPPAPADGIPAEPALRKIRIPLKRALGCGFRSRICVVRRNPVVGKITPNVSNARVSARERWILQQRILK